MKNICFLVCFISVNSFFAQEKLDKLLEKWNTRNVPYISAETLAMPTTKALLLDARKQEEYAISHLKNAIRVGYNDFNLKETLKKLPANKNTKIVVYCSLGIRSETVAHKLIQQGYTNVYNLYGGIFEWKNANFKVVNSLGKTTDSIHTFSKNWGKWLNKGVKVYK